MSDGLTYPPVGARVRVHTKAYSLAWMNVSRPKMPEGYVQDRRDKSVLVLGNQFGHSPYIEWDRVERIEYLDEDGTATHSESPVEAQQDAKEDVLQSWQVEGSKGKTYTVTKSGSNWSCTCVAGGFGKVCKHVTQKKEEVSAV